MYFRAWERQNYPPVSSYDINKIFANNSKWQIDDSDDRIFRIITNLQAPAEKMKIELYSRAGQPRGPSLLIYVQCTGIPELLSQY